MTRWKMASGKQAMSFLIGLGRLSKLIKVTASAHRSLSLQSGFRAAIDLVASAEKQGKKLILIGNGGSAAIASHQAVDYWKNGGVEAMAFNDASLLTCIGNDCGYENVFAVPMKKFARPSDVLIAISSSGQSKNILNGVRAAAEVGCKIITFSGFQDTNPLRQMGHVNFYVPSHAYGHVEVTHLALIHSMLRELIAINPAAAKNNY